MPVGLAKECALVKSVSEHSGKLKIKQIASCAVFRWKTAINCTISLGTLEVVLVGPDSRVRSRSNDVFFPHAASFIESVPYNGTDF